MDSKFPIANPFQILNKMMKNIAPDKWRHFYAGILMGFVLQILAGWLLPLNLLNSTFVVLVVVIVISYGFELFSLVTGLGRYDFMDAVASVIGGIVGMIPVILAQIW